MYCKPFLKWAGGKYRLLQHILPVLPAGERLVEPFAGAGSVFLNADYPAFLVGDANADVIALFRHVQDEGEDYMCYCRQFFTQEQNTAASFYHLRERFNASTDPAERGALLLYLNRHSFNGLIRYNAKGLYNAPFGRHVAPYFPHAELRHAHARCKHRSVTFMAQDFQDTFDLLRKGDVVYADPPYAPLSATASFTAYTDCCFTETHQQALAQRAIQAWQQGYPVLLSNHDTPFTRQLYDEARLYSLFVRRTISCNGHQRGKAPELLALYH